MSWWDFWEPNEPYLRDVSERLAPTILEFCREHVGKQFFADDLRKYVRHKVGSCAPGSADRVLRDLRQRGELEYSVVNRRKSLYYMEKVN